MKREKAGAPPEERLSIRASRAQKETLRRAAHRRQMNVSQFVLQTSLQEAEKVIQEDALVWLSGEDHKWLLEKLDEPPRSLSRLKAVLKTSAPWDE